MAQQTIDTTSTTDTLASGLGKANANFTELYGKVAEAIGGTTGSTDKAILRASGTDGSTTQSSLASVSDSGQGFFTGGSYNVPWVGTLGGAIGVGAGNGQLMQFIVNFQEMMLLANGTTQALTLAEAVKLTWASQATVGNGGSPDTSLARVGAGILGVSGTGTASELRIYGDATKCASLKHDGTNASLSPAGGSLLVSGLPTSSAGLPSGTLWNNGGVVNVAP